MKKEKQIGCSKKRRVCRPGRDVRMLELQAIHNYLNEVLLRSAKNTKNT
jgi:hypothetical protein